MELVLDFQGFKGSANGFIIKECAVLDINGSFIENWVVAPPYDFYMLAKEKRKQASWLTINHHGLKWDDGEISYNSFLEELRLVCSKANLVYMKGREKCDFARRLLGLHIIDLMHFGAPNIKTLISDSATVTSCYRHRGTRHPICTLVIASCLRNWVIAYNHVF